MKWVADVDIGSSPDFSDVEEAIAILKKKGATSFRLYISEKSGNWGYQKYINVNGYKNEPSS